MPLLNLSYNELYSAIRGMDMKSMTREQLKSLIGLFDMKTNQLKSELASRSRD